MQPENQKRKRYAQIGLGGRHKMFRDAVMDTYKDSAEMVALCDKNPGRLELSQKQAEETAGLSIPGYAAEDFEKMIDDTAPDTVIVTTMDATHDDYICRAMEKGCDIITEKPMTIDAQKCQRILDTKAKTGREIRVTFNYRYSPPRTQIKDLLMSGVIGRVYTVDFQWLLDTSHGADYFRRWHRWKENSGGLLVHKATHHFDLVNWWLSTVPESVYASGQRRFYVPETAERLGLKNRSERCHTCPELEKCRFALDMSKNEKLSAVYLECEKHDGYFRDRCVFDADMNIEDAMNVVVHYRNGAQLSYSLRAFSPWEGYTIAFTGSKGRLEHKCMETVYVSGDGSVPGELVPGKTTTTIYPQFADSYEVDIWEAEGGHGGGDAPLLEDVFSSNPQEDKYMRAADQRAGAWSILTGIAGNASIGNKRAVQIDELVSGLEMPEYPAMP